MSYIQRRCPCGSFLRWAISPNPDDLITTTSRGASRRRPLIPTAQLRSRSDSSMSPVTVISSVSYLLVLLYPSLRPIWSRPPRLVFDLRSVYTRWRLCTSPLQWTTPPQCPPITWDVKSPVSVAGFSPLWLQSSLILPHTDWGDNNYPLPARRCQMPEWSSALHIRVFMNL